VLLGSLAEALRRHGEQEHKRDTATENRRSEYAGRRFHRVLLLKKSKMWDLRGNRYDGSVMEKCRQQRLHKEVHKRGGSSVPKWNTCLAHTPFAQLLTLVNVQFPRHRVLFSSYATIHA
jgi:hypothetical protein